jgi:chemotaxis response regulator CheB
MTAPMSVTSPSVLFADQRRYDRAADFQIHQKGTTMAEPRIVIVTMCIGGGQALASLIKRSDS